MVNGRGVEVMPDLRPSQVDLARSDSSESPTPNTPKISLVAAQLGLSLVTTEQLWYRTVRMRWAKTDCKVRMACCEDAR